MIHVKSREVKGVCLRPHSSESRAPIGGLLKSNFGLIAGGVRNREGVPKARISSFLADSEGHIPVWQLLLRSQQLLSTEDSGPGVPRGPPAQPASLIRVPSVLWGLHVYCPGEVPSHP